MLPCLVLGGGLGTRLGHRTRSVPKPLVEVAGEPFVQRQLRWLASEGVTEVAYSIGHLGHLIRDELTRRPPPCAVTFVDEGDRALGTGGAVRLAIDEGAVGDAFLLLYGDSYLDIDVAAVVDAFERSGKDGLMAVVAAARCSEAANARYEDGQVLAYEKGVADPAAAGLHHVDLGLSAFRADAVRRLVPSGQRADLAVVHGTLAAEGRLAGFESERPFHEIGSPEGLAALEAHLRSTPAGGSR